MDELNVAFNNFENRIAELFNVEDADRLSAALRIIKSDRQDVLKVLNSGRGWRTCNPT
jgi:hypothetical protein